MIKNLQSLRGVAAILIFYHHFGFDNCFVRSFGDFGVAFFMMLSGFVTSLSCENKAVQSVIGGKYTDIQSFIKLKLSKIYPLYLFCWLLANLFLPYRGSRAGIILSFFMLQSWIPDAPVYFAGNAVSWFISDIMFCYLFFILTARFFNRSRLACVAVVLYFTAYFIVVALLPENLVHGIIYINPLMQLSSFILGVCLYKLYRRAENFKISSSAVVTVAEVATLSITIVMMAFCDSIPQRFSLASYWWIPAAMTIFVFAASDMRPGLVDRLLQFRPLQAFGSISFSFYLIHLLSIRAWRNLVEENVSCFGDIPMWAQSVALLVIVTVLSRLAEKYIVFPARRLLQSL